MIKSTQRLALSQTLIALAVVAAFSPAQAQQLPSPASWVDAGVGGVSGNEKDRARFGMFNGMRKDDAFLLLDFDYIKRDDASALWTKFQGRNLGLDNRDLGFSQQKQGDWRYSIDYSELVRRDPRTINTGMTGAGTTTPTVNLLAAPGTGSDLNLDLRRKSFTLAGDKWFGGNLQFEAAFKNEDKDGARFFGRGFTCTSGAAPGCTGPNASNTGWALLMVPEPVNSTIKQFDAKLNWSSEKFLLTGGYYGSFYNNNNGTVTPNVPGTLINGLGTPLPLASGLQSILGLPVALWPNNQAQQVYVDGNYRFTPTTRATFKYAYTHATQNQDFGSQGLTGAPAGVNNLGGVINTTLVQAGVTSRPMPKLSLLANVRYDNRDNKTPIQLYNVEGTAGTWTNGNPSTTKTNAKAEASYQFTPEYRGTLGVDYEAINYGTVTPTDNLGGISGVKQKTEESGYRLEMRRSMSETLTGALSFVSTRRTGDSPWLKPNSLPLTGVFPADPNCVSATVGGVPNACIYNRTGIFPFMYEDRERNKIRLMASFTPTDKLSLQFFFEDGKDTYHGPTEHGLRDTGMRMVSVDAAYALTDAWKLTGYVSQGDQIVHAGHSNGYDAALHDTNFSLGLGLNGKVSDRIRLGGDLMYLNDKLQYQQSQDPLESATNALFLAQQGGLPDVTYRLTRIKVFGLYSLDTKSSVRLDLVHQSSFFNEWTYGYNGVPFTYNDNTTLSSKQNQSVNFLGATYIYKF